MSAQLSTSECTIDFPTSPTWFRSIRQLITSATVQCGFSQREAGQCSMAVDEALSNIYRHGYHGSSDGRIRLTFRTKTEPHSEVTIEIEDDATQVDTNLIQSRCLEDIKPGGLGVHLIQTVMDCAHWEKRPEGGMKVTLIKRTTPKPNSTVQSSTQDYG